MISLKEYAKKKKKVSVEDADEKKERRIKL